MDVVVKVVEFAYDGVRVDVVDVVVIVKKIG